MKSSIIFIVRPTKQAKGFSQDLKCLGADALCVGRPDVGNEGLRSNG